MKYWFAAFILLVLVIVSIKLFTGEVNTAKFNKTYEAEDGILNGVKVSQNITGYSGNGYVTDFNKKNDSVTFKIHVPSKGLYILHIGYQIPTGSGKKYTKLILNDASPKKILLPESNEFTEIPGERVLLDQGENTIKFASDWGYYNLDYIKVQSASALTAHNVSKKLVNPNATKETKALMSFLVDNYGKRILSGQQDISEVKWLNKNIGKKPAIVGFDFMDYSPSRVTYGIKSNQTEQAIQWDKEGGIVTFSWHWNAPKDLIDTPEKKWRGFYKDGTTFDIGYAMNHPESEDYQLILRDIDTIALQLKKLQKAKVPVIFRPLHEAEGSWFWWGAKGPEPAKQLYRLMYDRLTNYHKINNLIWVWNSVSKDWYPGDEYVDIVSYDSYPAPGDYSSVSSPYDRLVSLVNNQKIVALSENGPIPSPDLLKEYQIHWSWFLTWESKFLRGGKINSLEHLNKVYHNPYVITLDELPNLKTYGKANNSTRFSEFWNALKRVLIFTSSGSVLDI
ncbi:glycosyl hydrolase [Ectobacillus panaciterrae]|uniref:glycosyl hydrolase n=1 Tax=Ectobacillus panaciterrae TaxID=363872 RepID=UPI00041DCA36